MSNIIQSKQLCSVNDEKRICFINIPKNASQTIMKNLKFERRSYSNIYKDYKKIVVIRDPMTRVISSYTQILKNKQPTNFYKYFKVRHDIKKSFELFLNHINNNFYDPHVIPQYQFLDFKGLTINDIDHVILFDNLNEELKKIITEYNLDCSKINQINKGSSQIKKVLKPVIGKYHEKILQIYSKDFELYNQVKKNIIKNK